MFTRINRNTKIMLATLFTIFFMVSLSLIFYADKISAQSLPVPPINENEVEDINIFAGSTFGGNSNVLLYTDMSQSMGTHFTNVQIGNWDGTSPHSTCELRQKVNTDYAKAHCMANAAGVTTFLVNQNGELVDSTFDTTTVPTNNLITDDTIVKTTNNINQAIFGGCGAISCVNSKHGTCDDPDEFGVFLNCIDTAYSDTIVTQVYTNALTVNCGGVPITVPLGTIDSLKTDLNNQCNTDAKRVRAAAAMDNYSNYLFAVDAGNSSLMTCGARECVTFTGAVVTGHSGSSAATHTTAHTGLAGIATQDHSCNDNTPLQSTGAAADRVVNEYTLFKNCMGINTSPNRKQSRTASCATGGTDAPYCAKGRYGSTRADGIMSAILQILDRDNSVKTTQCTDSAKLFNGVDSQISCFNYLNTPFRDLGDLPESPGSPNVPVVGVGNFKFSNFLTETDAQLAPFRVNAATFSGKTVNQDLCTSNAVFSKDQGGGGGNSQEKFRNAYDEFSKRFPTGRTALANALGLDDNNTQSVGIRDDILGIYRVTLNSDTEAACRGHFAIVITDGEDNCSGDCTTGLTGASTTGASCVSTAPAQTGNSNRRSVLQATSFARTHFARELVQGNDFNTEVVTFFIGWGVKGNPQAVRTLNAAALIGGSHTTGILRHRNPSGSLVGKVEIDGSPGVPGIIPPSEIDNVRDNFPWIIELAEMSSDDDDFSTDPLRFTLEDCDIPDENTAAEAAADITACQADPAADPSGAHCHLNNGAQSLFGDCYFDDSVATANSVGTSLLSSTTDGESFAFFVEDPGELVAALERIFEFTKGFTAVGQAPTVPPSVTAIGLRDRALIPNFTPIIGEPLWQGRVALYGFLDDPDNPGGKVIVRKPRTSSEFVTTDADGNDILDADAINSASIFTDAGSLNSNAKEFFWDAGKLLAERDIVGSTRNLLTVDSTVFQSFADSLIYTTGLIAFDKDLAPEVFGISDTDVDPGLAGSIIPICTDVCPDGAGEICDPAFPLTAACKTCVKEDCLRDKIVDFMSGNTGLLPVVDNLGEPTLDTCTDDIKDNTQRGVIGCSCPDIDITNTNVVTDSTIIDSLAMCERRLGDIFHSQPKIVQAPTLLFFDTGFVTFASAMKDRSAVIYAGANDGFLHAFHGGEFIDVINDSTLSSDDKKNPFTGIEETLPFIDEGTGNELFGYAPPTFLMDSIAPDGTDAARSIFAGFNVDFDPTSPGESMDPLLISSGPEPTPDFRFGDFKTLVERNLSVDVNSFQRAFFDGTPFIADVYLDGDGTQTNGLTDSDTLGCDDGDPGAFDGSEPGSQPDGSINLCGKEWRTIMMSGFRNGGGGLTVLDITNVECSPGRSVDADNPCQSVTKRFPDGPDYPEHLWTFFDRQMGNSWSQPKIGRIRVNYNDKPLKDRWVIFAGGGFEPVFTNPIGDDDADTVLNYEEDAYRGNAFYVIDIATGKLIYKFDKSDDSNFVCDVPADPNVIDTNADGYIDLVYIGDKCGRLWRFDVSEPIEANVDAQDAGIKSDLPNFTAPDWDGSVAFCVNDRSAVDNTCLDSSTGDFRNPVSTDTLFPIYFAPTSVIDDLGRRHVIFVTGDRAWPSNEDLFGNLYNFIDEYVPSFLAGGNPGPFTFKTASDIDTLAEGGSTFTLTGNGFQFSIENTSSDASDTSDPAQGEFIVEFPNASTSEDTNGDGIDDVEGGEIGIGTPVVINGVLIFTTFNPDAGAIDDCSAGLGTGRIFAIDFITGAAALFRIPGAQAVIGSDKTIAGIRGGEGMPTPAQLSYTSTGTITMTLAFSGSGVSGGAQFLVWELPRLPATTQTLYWEEVI